MSQQLMRQFEKLRTDVLDLARRVERMVRDAVTAVRTHDADLAKQVIDFDDTIDQAEVHVEEECLYLLALHQPVAHDLRFAALVLKINVDLERIADHAVNIAEQVEFLPDGPQPGADQYDFAAAGDRILAMLDTCLTMFEHSDADNARQVLDAQRQFVKENQRSLAGLAGQLAEQPEDISGHISVMALVYTVDRIAELASNIAEDIIYLAEGEIVRHGQ